MRALRLALLFLAACGRAPEPAPASDPLIVFAASDLRDALTEIAAAHRAAGGDSATLVFGSTGELATQIANGAPADLFFAANAAAIDTLAARGALLDSTRAVYAIGRVAVIGSCGARACTLDDLTGPNVQRVAIANPAHAPYGLAAKQALERAGLWTRLEPRLVLGNTVSQAEQFVTSGNADAGLVALSLAMRAKDRPYTLVDSALHAPLRQTVAVTRSSPRVPAAVRFLRFATGDHGRELLARYGFTAP
jgi:molybdate transport system substrate-binding protein